MSTVRPAHPRSRGENVPSSSVKGNEAGSSPLTRGKPVVGGYGDLRSGLIPAHAGKTQHNGPVAVEARAHPRSRGENQDENIINLSKQGSSPLTRGKPWGLSFRWGWWGLIPAHAGKTGACCGDRSTVGAHPRSRGENQADRFVMSPHEGSSPLTRGKLRVGQWINLTGGLIPAHAGKTGASGLRWNQDRAHPRSRGENSYSAKVTFTRPGSSPLTRGKRARRLEARALRGLIPAHAGKTDVTRARCCATGAHPRSRGENDGRTIRGLAVPGSSPLTRGKQDPATTRTKAVGLIPAHAGKTHPRPVTRMSSPAHPRSRGENRPTPHTAGGERGSSPLTRGKQAEGHALVAVRGLIPAHAGKTGTGVMPSRAWPAHPRSRGENAGPVRTVRACTGSSPLTRGKHLVAVFFHVPPGLIPAHAGKTLFTHRI